MGAKNKVVAGDYMGNMVMTTISGAIIAIGFTKREYINSSTVDYYEVVDSERSISGTSVIGRGALGGLLLGPVGLLAAATAKKKGIHTIAIQFKDGKKSVIEVDEKIYKQVIRFCAGCSQQNEVHTSNTNDSPNIQQDIPDQIKKLAELKDQGILTEEEFNQKKTELLLKM